MLLYDFFLAVCAILTLGEAVRDAGCGDCGDDNFFVTLRDDVLLCHKYLAAFLTVYARGLAVFCTTHGYSRIDNDLFDMVAGFDDFNIFVSRYDQQNCCRVADVYFAVTVDIAEDRRGGRSDRADCDAHNDKQRQREQFECLFHFVPPKKLY